MLDDRGAAWSDWRVPLLDRDRPADPYSPPGSDFNAGVPGTGPAAELAERGTRLWAAAIDGFLITLPLLPLLAVGIYFGLTAEGTFGELDAAGTPPSGDRTGLFALGGATVLGGLGALAVAIYQWVLISRTGQSLGKKWSGIRIERVDGGQVTFSNGVFLRNWVTKLIGSVPYLGAIFQLVDCLFIFRDDRRCIHDHIAGTRVVRLLLSKGEPWEGSPTLPRSGSAGPSPATPTRW